MLYLHGPLVDLYPVERFESFGCALRSHKHNCDDTTHDAVGSICEMYTSDWANRVAEVLLEIENGQIVSPRAAAKFTGFCRLRCSTMQEQATSDLEAITV